MVEADEKSSQSVNFPMEHDSKKNIASKVPKKPSTRTTSATGLWRKLELAFLFAYAGCFVLTVTYKVVHVSTEYGIGNKMGRLWGLREGWIMNKQVDLSDSQWRNFRGNIPVLAATMALFTMVSQGLRSTFQMRMKGMSWFWFLMSLAFVMHLHGASVVFILLIATGNFFLVKLLGGTSVLPTVLWGYNIFFLIANRVYGGYKFAALGEQWSFLDNHRGIMRWHISFNLVMLRMVSFGLDYHWARLSRRSTIDWEKHPKTGYLARQELALKDEEYNLVTYLSYLLFPPLYVAGPIISYNAFASQVELFLHAILEEVSVDSVAYEWGFLICLQLDVPQKSLTNLQVFTYGLRWLVCVALMEVMTHYCYFNSLAISGVWQMLSPLEIFCIGCGVLNFMWLKFLLIWRFFRFWALVAGIEAPENMLRCVNNCYDLEGFWKSWHSSYNRWLVRYMYIPLGGAQWRMINVWIIFTFVALWHDLEWKLLSWAWVTCLLWVPELTAKSVMQMKRMQAFKESPVYTECCAIGGAMIIYGLMIANLVGFVVGPSGMWLLASLMITVQNTPLLIGILATFYVGCKIAFYKREVEGQSSGKFGSD